LDSYSWFPRSQFHVQAVSANSSDDIGDEAVVDDDSRPVRLESVVLTDIFIEPGDSMFVLWMNQEDRTAVLK
jgi:hypothetical protein